MKRLSYILSLLVVVSMFLAACAPAATEEAPAATEAAAEATDAPAATEAAPAELSGTLNVWSFTNEIRTVHEAMRRGLILSAHDISEGGAAAALAEMSFKRSIGVKVEIAGDLALDKKLFGETGGFIFEVERDKARDLKQLFAEQQIPLQQIGETTLIPQLQINQVINLSYFEQ